MRVGTRSVRVIVGCCGHQSTVSVPCQAEPVNGNGATVGDELAIASGRDVERKGNVVESGFIQGFAGRRISDTVMEITGATGCGCDRLESRQATVWACRN